jgi:hypothetical protein
MKAKHWLQEAITKPNSSSAPAKRADKSTAEYAQARRQSAWQARRARQPCRDFSGIAKARQMNLQTKRPPSKEPSAQDFPSIAKPLPAGANKWPSGSRASFTASSF